MNIGWNNSKLLTRLIQHTDLLYIGRRCEVEKFKSNRKAMNRNWGNQKANPALKTKTGNDQIDKIQCEQIVNRAGIYFTKGGHSATQTELKV